MKTPPVLTVRNLTKRFDGIAANDRVDFDLYPGEIHALLGENGAGKSTLMHMVSGLIRPDTGQMAIDGTPVSFRSPKDAIAAGIHMVHQNFMLVPVFTVAENIVLGSEPCRGPILNMPEARRRIRRLSATYGLAVPPEAVAEDLPVGLQQRVEILKALYRRARILIFDEPTAVLSPPEVRELFTIMDRLAANDVAMVFITHKLKEVMACADRITVMRRGRMVGATVPQQTDAAGLTAMMIGKRSVPRAFAAPAPAGDVVLATRNLCVAGPRRPDAVSEVSLQIRAGEILGLAGVQGNGQSELAAALTGMLPIRSGTLTLAGREYARVDPRQMIAAGMGHIPEHRERQGLVLPFSVADNQVLCTYHRPPFCRYFLRNVRAVHRNSKQLIGQFDVRAPGPQTPVRSLSGGNRQKVVLSRELSRNPLFLLANQPTRGLDVKAAEAIRQQIVAMRNQGSAVLLISADLDEILSLSDRIAVMFQGSITSVVDGADASAEMLGLLMSTNG